MALETRKERVFYLGVVPVIGAILGALVASIFQALPAPAADLPSALEVLRDRNLSSADKVKLLEMIKEVGDRPWSIMRSLVISLTFLIAFCAPAISRRIWDR